MKLQMQGGKHVVKSEDKSGVDLENGFKFTYNLRKIFKGYRGIYEVPLLVDNIKAGYLIIKLCIKMKILIFQFTSLKVTMSRL